MGLKLVSLGPSAWPCTRVHTPSRLHVASPDLWCQLRHVTIQLGHLLLGPSARASWTCPSDGAMLPASASLGLSGQGHWASLH